MTKRRWCLNKVFASVVCGLLLWGPNVSAEAGVRQQQIRLTAGAAAVTVNGAIKGYQGVDYLLRAKAGQRLVVDFTPSNLSAYFNVLPPGTDEAIFIGSTSGNHCEAKLPTAGLYTLRVYLMRNAARRNETSRYTLKVRLANEDMPAAASSPLSVAGLAFDRTLELQGIRFQVTSANTGSLYMLRIIPAGLEIDNAPIERAIDGTVTGAEVADINGDGSPEIYVYVTSAGSGSYGTLVAYAANQRKSLSEIYLPPITQSATIAQGYRGHDAFAVLEGVLGQRFPIYRDADTNAHPTGGTRQLQYKLIPGEAGWRLTVDRVVEY